MSQLAVENNSVNLGQGFPGFPIDPKLPALVSKYMSEGYNQYAPMTGIPQLRELLSEKLFRSYGTTYDPRDEITITAGGTQAIFTAISALVKKNDEVILFAPAYDCYAPAIEMYGGKVVWIEMSYPDYSVDWDEVRNNISDKTRMIVINTPQNPAGTIWTEEDMLTLQKITTNTNIIVLSDEVYEHIIFDGHVHQSCARFPELAARSLIVFSFGKTIHVTGWKIGYIVGPSELMKELRKVHQYNVFSCNTPMQYAIAMYMLDANVYEGLSDFYQKKRDVFLNGLRTEQFEFTPAAGSYFQLLRYKQMNGRQDLKMAESWTIENKITCIPLSSFFPTGKDEGVFRFCFAKQDETLLQACEMLNQIEN